VSRGVEESAKKGDGDPPYRLLPGWPARLPIEEEEYIVVLSYPEP